MKVRKNDGSAAGQSEGKMLVLLALQMLKMLVYFVCSYLFDKWTLTV